MDPNLHKRSSAICAAALPIGDTAVSTWAVPYGADRFETYAQQETDGGWARDCAPQRHGVFTPQMSKISRMANTECRDFLVRVRCPVSCPSELNFYSNGSDDRTNAPAASPHANHFANSQDMLVDEF